MDNKKSTSIETRFKQLVKGSMKKYAAVVVLDFLPGGDFIDSEFWCGIETPVEEVFARSEKSARRKIYEQVLKKCAKQIHRLKSITIYQFKEVISDEEIKG